jgi:predicted DCC family thiol-disulfide oxidoreductase YuxK
VSKHQAEAITTMIWRHRNREPLPQATAVNPGEVARTAAIAEEWPATRSAGAASPTVTVFYDGSCPLCTAEIGFYRRRRGADRVGWVDVSACPAENVTAGLTRDQALRRFHVRDADGRLISGGQAFVVLWTALPGYAWMGRLFRLGPLAWTINRAYDKFLKWPPRLKAMAQRRLSRP